MTKFQILLALLTLLLFSLPVYALSLIDAQKDYLQGHYEEAIEKAKRLRETDQTLYFLSLVHIKIGDYPKAEAYLRRLIKRFPNSSLYCQGLVKLVDTYFLQKDYSNAKQLYQEIEKRYPDLNNRPLVLLRLAQIASRQGNWDEKHKYLELIKTKYPQSSEMKFVNILEEYGDFFTIQVGAFSEAENAQRLKEELSQKYKAYIVEDKKGNYPIYKVRVGKFKKREEVEKVAAKLRNKGYPVRIYP